MPRASGFGSNWATYHATAEATGVQRAQTKLLPARRAWTSSILDGQLYGEPLVADDRVVAATGVWRPRTPRVEPPRAIA